MPYAAHFRDKDTVQHYESIVYSPDSYPSYIWELQKHTLKDIIQRHRPDGSRRVLDFACGTGRILSFVEEFVDHSDGIDISPEMVEIAREKCKKSSVIVGDILGQSGLAAVDYDFVTMFRFLLNAEDETRRRILTRLREYLLQRNGLLIANVHSNANSVRALSIAYRRNIRGEAASQLSRKQIRQLFADTGFEIVEEHGFGVLPPVLHRTLLSAPAKWIDSTVCKIPLFTPISIDLLYVCRPV